MSEAIIASGLGALTALLLLICATHPDDFSNPRGVALMTLIIGAGLGALLELRQP